MKMKPSKISLLLVLLLMCSCNSIKHLSELASMGKYADWQNAWEKRMRNLLIKKDLMAIAYKNQAFDVIDHLLLERKLAIEKRDTVRAKEVGFWLPILGGHDKDYSSKYPKYAALVQANISEYPKYATLIEAIKDAPCLVKMVGARKALTQKNYRKALTHCNDCPLEATTQDVLKNRLFVQGEFCLAMEDSIRMFERNFDWMRIACVIKYVDDMTRQYKIDQEKIPHGLSSSIANYKIYFNKIRTTTISQLKEKIKISGLENGTEFEQAKQACIYGRDISGELDQKAFDVLKGQVESKGTTYYLSQSNQALQPKLFNLALADTFIHKAFRLNRKANFLNTERAKMFVHASDFFSNPKNPNYEKSLEYVFQAERLDGQNKGIQLKRRDCEQRYLNQVKVMIQSLLNPKNVQFEAAKKLAEETVELLKSSDLQNFIKDEKYKIMALGTKFYLQRAAQESKVNNPKSSDYFLKKAKDLDSTINESRERAKLLGIQAVFFQQNNRLDSALILLNRAVLLDPQNRMLSLTRQQCQQQHAKQLYNDALLDYDQAQKEGKPSLFRKALTKLKLSLSLDSNEAVSETCVLVKNDYGEYWYKEAQKWLREAQYDRALRHADSADAYLLTKKYYGIIIKETKGTKILDFAEAKIKSGFCLKAYSEILEAKKLFTSTNNRVIDLEAKAVECAKRRVLVEIKSEKQDKVTTRRLEEYLPTIRQKLSEGWGDHFLNIENSSEYSPDYKIIFTLRIENAPVSKSTEKTACTAKYWHDEYGKKVYSYSSTVITEYYDSDEVTLTITSKIVRIKDGSVHYEIPVVVKQPWNSSYVFYKDGINPATLRDCPSGSRDSTYEKTAFLPQHNLLREKPSVPSSFSLIKQLVEPALIEIAKGNSKKIVQMYD